MTFTITKTKMALSILVVALAIPATALATHVFDDVPDDAFYADPVEWAFDNEITTGKSPTQFAPLDNVTRGESVTFLQRYNDNVVQPALDEKADIADVYTRAEIDAMKPFALSSRVDSSLGLDSTDEVVTSFSLTPSVSGELVVSSSLTVFEATEDQGVECSISTTSSFDSDYRQKWVSPGTDPNVASQLSGTRLITVTGGVESDVSLVCHNTGGGSSNVFDAVITGVFVAD